MSLTAMTFGDRFCFSKKGGIGGGGWVHPKGADSMAISGLSSRYTLVNWLWVGHAVLICANSPLTLHGAHFWWGNLFASLAVQIKNKISPYTSLVHTLVQFIHWSCPPVHSGDGRWLRMKYTVEAERFIPPRVLSII